MPTDDQDIQPGQPGQDAPAPVAPPGLGYVPQGYLPPEAAPQRTSRLGLWWGLGALALVLVVAGTIAGFVIANRWDGRAAPGDAALTLHVVAPDGTATPSPADLDRTRQVLLARMRAAGLTRPTVTVIGTDTLRVTTAPGDVERARSLIGSANLTMRRVLQTTQDHPVPGSSPAACATGSKATLASVKAKLGATYTIAEQIQDPAQADVNALAPFATLTCAEVTVLPAQTQFFVPTVSCAMLNSRTDTLPTGPDPVVACDRGADVHTKYALDVAKVNGTDLEKVKAVNDPANGGWQITLHFTSKGQSRWTAMTQEAMRSAGSGAASRVAILVDDQILSAPQIMSVITGDAIIAGGFDERGAKLLAADLNYGALPVRLTIAAVETVR